MKTNQTEVKNPEKKYLEIVNEYFKRGLTDIGFKLISKIENKDTRRKVIAAVTASFIGLSNVPAVNAITSELPNTNAITTTNILTAKISGSVKAFPDVVNNHWARDYIYKLVAAQIVNGYPDGTFAPNKTITRAEFAKMLIAPLNFNLNSTSSSFSDVANTNWASKYIEAAKANGLLYDDGTNKFNPNVPITREYAAFMMGKAIEMTHDSKNNNNIVFTDANTIAKPFATAVSTTVDYGIINGYPDGSFGPKKSITRAEASKIMTLGIELINNITLEMPKVEQPIMAWVAEDPKGTIDVRPCDGVTRRLVKTEKEQSVTLYLPLTGNEVWSSWVSDRLEDGQFNTYDELISKKLVIEETSNVINDFGQSIKIYRYKCFIDSYFADIYYYEVYKPVAEIREIDFSRNYTGKNEKDAKVYRLEKEQICNNYNVNA